MEEVEHKDHLNRKLSIGDHVVIAYGGQQLNLCQVVGFTPKMVRIVPMKYSHAVMKKGFLRYGRDMAIMPGEEVFIHVLTS